jgi:hypothetical protein
VLLAGPSRLAAQDPAAIPVPMVEVSGGYTFMRDFSTDLPEDVNSGRGLAPQAFLFG